MCYIRTYQYFLVRLSVYCLLHEVEYYCGSQPCTPCYWLHVALVIYDIDNYLLLCSLVTDYNEDILYE